MTEQCKKLQIQIDAYKEAAELWSARAIKLEKKMRIIEDAIEKYPDFKEYMAGYNCGGYHD